MGEKLRGHIENGIADRIRQVMQVKPTMRVDTNVGSEPTSVEDAEGWT